MSRRVDRAKATADVLWSLADLGHATAEQVAAHAGLQLALTHKCLRRLERANLVRSEEWAAVHPEAVRIPSDGRPARIWTPTS